MARSLSLIAFLASGVLAAELAAQPREAARRAQRPQETQEQFHKMSPEERLIQVAKKAGADKAFVPVVRDDLNLSVVERGSVESADAVDIISRVKGQTTVKWVIDDGTAVKKGQRLLELDDSALREQQRGQQLTLEQTHIARLAAEANLKLTRKETELAVRGGEIALKTARLELKSDVSKDAGRKEVLELKVEQAQLVLDTSKLRGQVRELKAEAELKATVSAEEQEAKRKNDIEAQLAECVIKAPQAGLVVYRIPEQTRIANPAAILGVGEPVREGQKLMRVCGLERFTVLTRVHEADIPRVRVGQPAPVRVDAFPDQSLRGQVKEVSPVASQREWMTRDVKVYPVVVELAAAPPGLRPGLSAEIHIAAGARLPKVLQVPVSSVVRIGRETFCYVRVGNELQERKVTLGANNGQNVEIKEGLKEGDVVLRAPAW